MRNEDKVRDMLNKPEVPEELTPDKIREMLDREAPAKKRSGIKKTAMRITAGAAACAVICGGAVYAGKNGIISRDGGSSENSESSSAQSGNAGTAELASYMSGASDYAEVYQLLERSHEKYEKRMKSNKNRYNGFDYVTGEEVYEDAVESSAAEDEAMAPETNNAELGIADSEDNYGGGEESPEFSETHDQEEGVREADKVKTDGKYIYYLAPGSNAVNIAETNNGTFTETSTLSMEPTADQTESYLHDMYLYDDMLIVIGSVYDYSDEYSYWGCNNNETFVRFYTTGLEPELIGEYRQDGDYNSVRIAPDGCMYLVSAYFSAPYDEIEDEEDYEGFIPSCGEGDNMQCIPPEDVLMPCETPEADSLSFTVISGIDLNTPGEFTPVAQKALAGYSGDLYCSAENIYTTEGYTDTNITRIAISGGEITPMASGTVEGYVNDQFSMSEYGGYFRVATTRQKYTENGNFITDMFGIERSVNYISDNMVYVLDMDMNQVGYIDNFGNNETIKSVNFNGDMGYVVTYERTDPLFAIDLSDPANPTITDEFKIMGYSSYMQSWGDGLLLGFGVDADENAIENGVKAVMFDNSDPENLQEVGLYTFHNETSEDGAKETDVYSPARWDRKALLIAPEKNLIGIPLQYYTYQWVGDDYDNGYYDSEDWCEYAFLSYEDGQFTYKGSVKSEYASNSDRAVYIGDYVYVLSGSEFVAADINSLEETDRINF